jgi:hypothetical protein
VPLNFLIKKNIKLPEDPVPGTWYYLSLKKIIYEARTEVEGSYPYKYSKKLFLIFFLDLRSLYRDQIRKSEEGLRNNNFCNKKIFVTFSDLVSVQKVKNLIVMHKYSKFTFNTGTNI